MEEERKPWLQYSTSKALKNHSISDPTEFYSIRNPNLGALKLRTIQHGWYLLEHMSHDVSKPFLWNPHNPKKFNLPPLKHNGTKFGNCILTSPPTTNDETCSIYLFSSHSLSMFYYQLGDKQWTKVCFYNEIVRLRPFHFHPFDESRASFDNPVYFNGCLYAGIRTTDTSLFILALIEKLQTNGFKINCTPYHMFKRRPTSSFEQYTTHLLGSNNVLFLIQIFHSKDKVTAVFVYKFSHDRNRMLEKVDSIKDRMFFISSLDPAFACQTINPETEGGRIYIARKNCNFVYIYNIEDKSLVISQPLSNLPKKRSYLRWFLPDTGMTSTLKEETEKARQTREKESVCGAVKSKDAVLKARDESALPLDVVEVIAKYLNNVLDYLHFRASNNLFRLAAPPIQWGSSSSMSMSRFDDLSMSPLFVFSATEKDFTFVHPKHGLAYKYIINWHGLAFKYIINWPWSKGGYLFSEICCSKDGWISNKFQVFYNPFTKQLRPHPRLGYREEIKNTRCFGMSHSPTSSECIAVELGREIKVHDPFNGAVILYDCKEFPVYNISPVFHNGLFYCLSMKGKLGVIEATREKINWKEIEGPQAPYNKHFNNFLVECDGNLLAVLESSLGKGVRVFKLDESTMTWMKVESLQNHMLFVGKTSFSAVANIPGMENKIYFSRFYGQNVVFYSLDTNNYHTFENDEVVNFHHMREHLDGCWIQPRWH